MSGELTRGDPVCETAVDDGKRANVSAKSSPLIDSPKDPVESPQVPKILQPVSHREQRYPEFPADMDNDFLFCAEVFRNQQSRGWIEILPARPLVMFAVHRLPARKWNETKKRS